MAKRYLHNHGAGILFVAGLMIQPGEGREVDEAFLPPEHLAPPDEAAAAPAGSTDDALIAAMTAEIAKPLAQIVPDLKHRTAEELGVMRTLEDASATPRKTLQAKIAEALLNLAQAKAGGAPE